MVKNDNVGQRERSQNLPFFRLLKQEEIASVRDRLRFPDAQYRQKESERDILAVKLILDTFRQNQDRAVLKDNLRRFISKRLTADETIEWHAFEATAEDTEGNEITVSLSEVRSGLSDIADIDEETRRYVAQL